MLTNLLGGLLLLFGLFIVTMSYVRQIKNTRNRESGPYSSPAPFVGPIFVVAGYAMLPLPFSWWIFLIFLLDPDTVVITAGVFYLIFGAVFRKGTGD